MRISDWSSDVCSSDLRQRVERVEQEMRIDLIMQRAELCGLRFDPEMIGAPFDRAHFIGIAEGDVKRGPDREEEIPADRTVEDQHHLPRQDRKSTRLNSSH